MSHCALRRAALGAALVSCWAGVPARAQEPMTLAQVVAMALERGLQARAAEATRDAARARDREFHSRLLPQLSLSGNLPAYDRSIIPVVQPDGSTLFLPLDQTTTSMNARLEQALPLTGGSFFVESQLSRLSITGAQEIKTWRSRPVTFGISQPILRPNITGWNGREQPVRAELAERQFREAREDIALRTADLFFDVYAAEVTLATATNNAAVNDTLYTLNKGRYEVGRIGENDLLQSELALLRSRTTLDGARLEHRQALAALRIALHLAPDAPLAIVGPERTPEIQADTLVAVAQALRNRASVSDVELQRVQADRRVVDARLNNGFGATVNASYGYNTTADNFDLAYRNLQESRALTLSVDIPLWQWGARGENVAAAKADRDRVESNAQATLDQTAHEAHFAALQLAQARRSLLLSATADTVAGKRFEVAYNRYVIGRITIDILYIAQQEKDQARTQYVNALRNYWQAYYRLRRLTLYDFEADRPIL